jgi:hypothetical protein
MRRLASRYIRWVEISGYLFVLLLFGGILAACFYQVEVVVKQNGDPELLPRETPVTCPADCVVTRLLVRTPFATVRQGDPLVEVVADPKWVPRVQAAEQARAALQVLATNSDGGGSPRQPVASAKPGGSAANPPSAGPVGLLRGQLSQALGAWDSRARPPRLILRAPHAGAVTFDKNLRGKLIGAGKEILKIVNFDQLQVTVRLVGEDLPQVENGDEVRVRLRPSQPPFRVVRTDAETALWQARRVQIAGGLDEATAAWLEKEMREQRVTADNGRDIPLQPKDLLKLEVEVAAVIQPAPDQPRADFEPEELHLLTLPGHVVDAKHIGKITVARLPIPLEVELRERIRRRLAGKTVGDSTPFRIDTIRDPAIRAQVSIETRQTPRDEADRVRGLRTALQGNRDERFVDAIVSLENPPPTLRRLVEQRYRRAKPAGPLVDVEVISSRKPFVSLLFKQ